MNLSIATFFFVAASASAAHNLRAHAPVRYLNAHKSSSSSSATDYDVACVITCPGLGVDELEKAAEKALEEINSSSSSTSYDDGQQRGLKAEREFVEINDCSQKSITKELESLESTSSSRRGRVRRLSKDDSNLRMTCIDASSEGVKQMAANCGGMKKLAKTLRDSDRRRLSGETDVEIFSAGEELTRAIGNGCDKGSGSSD